MRTEMAFRSRKFPPEDTTAFEHPDGTVEHVGDECNPGCWGHKLAEYVRLGLRERGFAVGEPFAEDWGWVVPIEHQAFKMWIGCGNRGDDDEFLVFIHPSTPTVRRGLFGKVDTTADVARVADALEAMFKSDPDIHDVCWEA